MHEPKISMSAKGKAREDTHWQLGWWDLYALVESPPRPIAWSKSSVIFTPHPTQALVLARHFPSSRQFVLPSPVAWASIPVPYEPPSVISVSPRDDFLFAYFASHDGDGAACLWSRGHQLDSWTIQQWWTLAKGSDVVVAEWTAADRDWTVSESGQPYRLPPRGPTFLMSNPILLLVTRTHQVHVCVLPPIVPTMKILKASLLHPSTVAETQAGAEDFPSSSHGGQRVCVSAAIGINYNDSTIVIATRSHLLPTHTGGHVPFNTMDLALHLDMAESNSTNDNLIANEWEQWGEEPTIELAALAIKVNGLIPPVIRVVPLSPLKRPGSKLTHMRFCSIPPDTVPPSPTITRDPRRPVKDSASEKASFYLVASFLDFDDYTSLPKSEISSFLLIRGKGGEIVLQSKGERTKSFDTGTIAFLAPSPSPKRLLVGFLDSNGTTTRVHAKLKEAPIGHMSLLNLSDLSFDDQWEAAPIVSPIDSVGRDIPVSVAISQNHALICSQSSSTIISARTTVHALPRYRQGSPAGSPRTDLSRALVSSIFSRKSPSDVIHALTMQVTPLDTVFNSLYGALSILETHSFGHRDMWIDEILGVATEIYVARAKRAASDAEKDALTEWGKTAHDLSSVVALNSAFEDCREGDAYDLEAVWQLVGLSLWLISYLERLMKQCVYVSSKSPAINGDQMQVDANAHTDMFISPGASVLLSLVHPHAVGNLVAALGHVRRFHDDLTTLSPKSENAQMAKDVLLDGVDGSGVHLDRLEPLLQEFAKEASKIPADDAKKSLVSCTLTPALQRFVRPAVDKVLSSDVIDRLRLFIKPSDLIDGVSRLSVTEQVKEQESDVVSKGVLLHTGVTITCLRCGGQSEIGGEGSVAGHTSMKWHAWEKIWATRCVCGGPWIRPTIL